MALPNERFIGPLTLNRAQLLIIDIQEKLLPFIHGHAEVVAAAVKMIRAAAALEIPTTLSEQYPKGIGTTIPAIREAAGNVPRCEKLTFSFCADAVCQARLAAQSRPQVLLVGIETHVCVQQTALDLLSQGMTPVVLADAVGSRRALDYSIALERMRAAGAIVTTVESAIFEMVHDSGTALFKRILPVVR
jgi:isochorismate hydrolase